MSEEIQEPRLDVVNDLYDVLDEGINKLYKDKNISYGEIEIALMMMKEKLLQQKIQLMYAYIQSEASETSQERADNTETKPEPENLYK